ncbi:MAG: response regulator transcription factor [Acidobacteria bacterium]|nr:response regulator transcription factor [Acidobacteriota bacterium]
MRVLIIDDDTELCALLGEFLRREGFEVAAAHDGLQGAGMAVTGAADIVVLDVMLPGADGFKVLKQIREKSRIPVIMLTARGEDIDRIVGLELGADDYLPKPFNARELAARLRAILRRLEAKPEPAGAILAVNGVALDPATRMVHCDGHAIELTTFEFDILHHLMKAAGRVLSRDDLMEQLYQRKSTPFDRAIDVHVSHLRRKLETTRPLIKTIRGVGYQFLRSSEDERE